MCNSSNFCDIAYSNRIIICALSSRENKKISPTYLEFTQTNDAAVTGGKSKSLAVAARWLLLKKVNCRLIWVKVTLKAYSHSLPV